MARPLKQINPDEVRALARIHCTDEEIAAVLHCSVDTLKRRFAEVIQTAKEEGRASLRRQQYLLAQKGDKTMLVWLGKQLLGQSDRNDVQLQHSGHVGVSVDLSVLTDDELRRIASGG